MSVPPPTHEDLVSYSRLAAERLTELASGVDSLYLSGRCELPQDLLRSLEEGKEAASREEPVDFIFGEQPCKLAGHGWGKYQYRLQHAHGLIGLTTSSALPTVRIQPRAEFLHGIGVGSALAWFDQMVRWESDDIVWTTSRVDLFSDWQGWELQPQDRDRFTCRAGRRDTHEDGALLTGFEFGRRNTGTICARIYDKTHQVKQKGLDWWPDVWGSQFDGSRPVLRVEFEFGRSALREFGTDSPTEVLEAAGGLWASAAEDWLTFRDRSSDQTRSRWPLSAEWRQIQHPSMRGEAIGLERTRAGKRKGSLRKLMPALNGYLASFGALVDTEDIPDTLAALPQHLRDYELRSGVTFANRVHDKRQEAS